MIVGVGTDIIEIDRIGRSIERGGNHFKDYVYSRSEIEYCESKKGYESFAARFAAKEAFSKAMGTGIGKDLSFKDIEVINDKRGKPSIIYHGDLLNNYKDYSIHLSLSHSKTDAIAYVVVEAVE
ncbi:MAG: holo-[acyl-carrier-protein] synthase [Candidatus Cloacimonadota bacterium]|nr:MAG: holo-[acyl-carrier-protein] synthase [Candidatus Cloacimonadota bacterium]PIE79097.1 MAG: holo-[acyl-carrier-protein] synthase [Candidatus Delongbacteria bacterium]